MQAGRNQSPMKVAKKNRSGIYSYEQRSPELVEPYLEKLNETSGVEVFPGPAPLTARKLMTRSGSCQCEEL